MARVGCQASPFDGRWAVLCLACVLWPVVCASQDTPAKPAHRWLEIQAASLAARFRYQESSANVVTARQVQYSGQVKARLSLDGGGRLSVTGLLQPGGSFTSSWNTTGIGTGDWVRTWSLKHLYITAAPVHGVEVSAGSLGFVRGESTEITSYDNDGYLAGERLCVKRPADVFFDEVSVTSGFLGDLAEPALWDRWNGLTRRRNYVQGLVVKTLSSRLSASADYTRVSGVGTFRTALAARLQGTGVLDRLRVEHYVRGGPASAHGFAVSAEKAIAERLTAGVGFASIDPDFGPTNSDRFGRGRRFFQTTSVRLTPEWSCQIYVTHAIDRNPVVPNGTRVDVGLSYNVLGALRRAGHLK